MMAISLCVLSFALSYLAGRRSLAYGLLAALASGYVYGILRANLQDSFSHFIFDAGVVGLYLSQPWFGPNSDEKLGSLRPWTFVLIACPLLICLIPFQTPLISVVGLRGNAFLLPSLLLGARLRGKDLLALTYGLAILNLIAFGFAMAEYLVGVETFFPLTEVTKTIYGSQDVAGYTFMRIPATFVTSAAYAGTMVVTLPFLYGAWTQRCGLSWRSVLLLVGMIAALLGVLMGASRSHFIVASALIMMTLFSVSVSAWKRMVWLIGIVILMVLALSNERFQRFKSLGDHEMIAERFSWSVNRTFWEILTEYPMGNGLGGGGTSIPYFLQHQIRTPILIENEYARILLEQGLVGLLLWTGFVLWTLTRRSAFAPSSWRNGRRIAWLCCACYFGTGLIGTGLLTAIPQSLVFLLLIGWITTHPGPELHRPTFSPTGVPTWNRSLAESRIRYSA